MQFLSEFWAATDANCNQR